MKPHSTSATFHLRADFTIFPICLLISARCRLAARALQPHLNQSLLFRCPEVIPSPALPNLPHHVNRRLLRDPADSPGRFSLPSRGLSTGTAHAEKWNVDEKTQSRKEPAGSRIESPQRAFSPMFTAPGSSPSAGKSIAYPRGTSKRFFVNTGGCGAGDVRRNSCGAIAHDVEMGTLLRLSSACTVCFKKGKVRRLTNLFFGEGTPLEVEGFS
jgi:hypothetical protein